MCGIVGLIAKRKWGFYQGQTDILKELLFVDTLRGPDSTGVFGVTKNSNVTVVKAAVPGSQFVEMEEFKKFQAAMVRNYVAVIGHNRKATRGTVNAKNAHPFKVGDITLVHNGSTWDHDKEFEVDSHAITADIEEKGEFEAIGNIKGSYALVWFNKKDKTLNMVRNDQRPLCLIETDVFWVVSSEAALAHAILLRNNVKMLKMHMIPPMTMVSFNAGKEMDTFYTVEIEKLERKPIPKDDKVIDITAVETKKEKEEPKADETKATSKSGLPPDEGNPHNYEIVDSHGQWHKGELIVLKPVDYKPAYFHSSTHNFVFFDVIDEHGKPMPKVVARLYVDEETTNKYLDGNAESYFVGKTQIIKNPKTHYQDDRVIIVLSADLKEIPRHVDAMTSKNGFFVEKGWFGKMTPTGCRKCQVPLLFENVKYYNMLRDADSKPRFYCMNHSPEIVEGKAA